MLASTGIGGTGRFIPAETEGGRLVGGGGGGVDGGPNDVVDGVRGGGFAGGVDVELSDGVRGSGGSGGSGVEGGAGRESDGIRCFGFGRGILLCFCSFIRCCNAVNACAAATDVAVPKA